MTIGDFLKGKTFRDLGQRIKKQREKSAQKKKENAEVFESIKKAPNVMGGIFGRVKDRIKPKENPDQIKNEKPNDNMALQTNLQNDGSIDTAPQDYATNDLWSTKETPTSLKLGVARPGPSTFVQAAKYFPDRKQLNVQYTDGKIFPYKNVSQEDVDGMVYADSIGQVVTGTGDHISDGNRFFKGKGTTAADEIGSLDTLVN